MSSVFFRNFDIENIGPASESKTPLKNVDIMALEDAQKKGFDEGFEAGKEAMRAEIHQDIEARKYAVLEGLSKGLQDFMRDTVQSENLLETQFFDFAISVGERVMPELIETRAHHRTMAQIRKGVRMALGSRQLQIWISKLDHELLGDELEILLKESGMSDKTALIADEDIEPGDVKLSWDHGGLEYSFALMCREILENLKKSRPKR